MSNYPNNPVHCPYNKNHILSESKLLSHLTKGCKDKVKFL